MAKRGLLVLDLAAFSTAGAVQFIPARALPRQDKQKLELECATILLDHLSANGEHRVEKVRPNPTDPPDVLFDSSGTTRGVELVELVPEGRLAKDHQIGMFRDQVLNALRFGPNTRNWQVNVFMADDYASRLAPQRSAAPDLAGVLSAFFDTEPDGRTVELPIPTALREVIRRVSATRTTLSDDPRVRAKDAPLITLGAQHTRIVPDDDFPPLLDATLGRKLLHNLDSPTWLLIWSHHPAFAPLRHDLVHHIGKWFFTRPSGYERIFYLHRQVDATVTEFYQGQDAPNGT